MTASNTGLLHKVFFEPESSWPLAVVRILLGTAIFGWAISLMFDVSTMLSEDGLVTSARGSNFWRPLKLASESSVWVALVVLSVSSLLVIVGFRPTVFLLLSFVLMLSLQRRNPMLINSGDFILRNLTLLLAFTPSGAALSVDRWRKHGRAALRTAPSFAPWGLRLLQVQMMMVYFIAFFAKSGYQWTSGTAVSTAMRLTDLQRMVAPESLTHSVPAIAMLTWGTLALEAALALLLWNRKLRPALIVLGVFLHLFIDTLMLVGFFGPAMIAGLMGFLDGDAIQRRVSRFFGSDEVNNGEPVAAAMSAEEIVLPTT